MILWEMVTKKIPFGEYPWHHELEPVVLSGKRPEIPEGCPPLFSDLMQSCWKQNPEERLSFVQVVSILETSVSGGGAGGGGGGGAGVIQG